MSCWIQIHVRLSPSSDQPSISFQNWHIPYNEAIIVYNHLVFRPLKVDTNYWPTQTHPYVLHFPGLAVTPLHQEVGEGEGVKTSLPVERVCPGHSFCQPDKKAGGVKSVFGWSPRSNVKWRKSERKHSSVSQSVRWLLISFCENIKMQQTMAFPQTGHFNQQVKADPLRKVHQIDQRERQ